MVEPHRFPHELFRLIQQLASQPTQTIVTNADIINLRPRRVVIITVAANIDQDVYQNLQPGKALDL